MIARHALAISLGATVTLCLLFIMQALIAHSDTNPTEASPTRVVDFVRVEPPVETIPPRRDRPEKPPEPTQPPQPTPSEPVSVVSTRVNSDITRPDMSHRFGEGMPVLMGDSDVLPVARATPLYPTRAIQAGLEGWVLVEFTVTRSGTTREVIVVDSSNRLFEPAAIEAAHRFRYRPRVIDGEPVEVSGVRNLFTFELDD